MTYKSILLATDFSKHSEIAGERAVDLAQRYDAKLTLFHMVEFFAPEIIPSEWLGAIEEEGLDAFLKKGAQKSLAEFAKSIDASDAEQIVITSTHSPKHETLRFAKEQDVDLIVLGSHGQHGIDALLGSTASGILHRAHCDVLSVRIDV